ncbi:hypothetical protein HPULCUR_001588 [Helicostylum pulchrum]|uniref:Uncharacterized protein n=1 Tax=Helicostylum pulchrum TaxID=562976 RepID=A0ABP9XP30_9FUNG
MNKSKQYNYTNDDVPLSTKFSQDDEHKYPQDLQYNNQTFTGQVKQSKASLFVEPVFSIFVSVTLSIVLLLIFLHVDGKLLDYNIIGMKIPSLVSLLLSINAIFIASGISTAISEYKWVRLQNGAPLTLIDIYDGCTRGLSGFFATLKSLEFDFVLIMALVFHIGLLVASPASQAIIVAINDSYNRTDIDIRFYYYRSNDFTTRSGLGTSRQPPLMNGLATNGYITASSFAQAAIGAKPSATFSCPEDASYCMFYNVSYISTSMQCTNITGKETAIANHDGGTKRSVIVLDEYYTSRNITDAIFKFPKFLYSTEMLGRTYYDLANYTQPLMPGLGIPLTQALKDEYDPQYRPYVGDQIFIMAYSTRDNSARTVSNFTELSYKKCSFTSSFNTSTWKTVNGTLIQDRVESSVPIVFDYDNILGNNTALDSDSSLVKTMINAYIMQQAIIYELTTPKYYTITDYMRTYSYTTMQSNSNNFEQFMKEGLAAFDFAFFQSPAVSSTYQDIKQLPSQGYGYFNTMARYKVNKKGPFVLFICLVASAVWWLSVWVISLKKNRGVTRGSSQIALLSTSMTPLAELQLCQLSSMDKRGAFKQAKDLRVRLGVSNDRIAFGMDSEHDLQRL